MDNRIQSFSQVENVSIYLFIYLSIYHFSYLSFFFSIYFSLFYHHLFTPIPPSLSYVPTYLFFFLSSFLSFFAQKSMSSSHFSSAIYLCIFLSLIHSRTWNFKGGLNIWCFDGFVLLDLEMCFAPQRHANLSRLNFQEGATFASLLVVPKIILTLRLSDFQALIRKPIATVNLLWTS